MNLFYSRDRNDHIDVKLFQYNFNDKTIAKSDLQWPF